MIFANMIRFMALLLLNSISINTCLSQTVGNGYTCKGIFNEESCVQPDTSLVCSNRGKCECGICMCRDGYNGKYCECDTQRCYARGSNLECSGPDKGICNCGQCLCKPGYIGAHCGCEISQRYCKREDESELCNGHGYCECNECKCNNGWDGRYCDICVSKGVGDVANCPCGADIQQFISCAINDVRIEGEKSTRFEINVKENATEECYKRDESTFELEPWDSEPIILIPKNEYNVNEGKQCVTALKSEYRTDCEILFAYEVRLRSFADFIASKNYYKEVLNVIVQDQPSCLVPPKKRLLCTHLPFVCRWLGFRFI